MHEVLLKGCQLRLQTNFPAQPPHIAIQTEGRCFFSRKIGKEMAWSRNTNTGDVRLYEEENGLIFNRRTVTYEFE